MITLSPSTAAALQRIVTALPTSDQGHARKTVTQLPDGAIRCCIGRRCDTVSSWHLVAGKIAQLTKLNTHHGKPR